MAIKLNQIRAFIEVAKSQSFAKASQELHLTKAAVSLQVSHLEEYLDAQLFTRTTRSITLTELGQLFLEKAQHIVNEVTSAEQLVKTIHEEPVGQLHVATIDYFARHHIVPYLDEFSKHYPKLEIKLSILEYMASLKDEKIDLFYGITLWRESETVSQRYLLSTRCIYCATPQYLKKYGTPKTPKDLLNHSYIEHSGRPAVHRAKIDGQKTIPVTPRMYMNNMNTLRDCVLNHYGIALFHDYEVNDLIEKGKLCEVLTPYTKEKDPVYIYYEAQRYLQPKIQRFIDFILQKIL